MVCQEQTGFFLLWFLPPFWAKLPVMTRDEVAAIVSEHNPDALLADGFEDAFIGVAQRCGQPTLALYDYDKGVEVLMNRDGMDESEAEEWMSFNVLGAWAGDQTPLWFFRGSTDLADAPLHPAGL